MSGGALTVLVGLVLTGLALVLFYSFWRRSAAGLASRITYRIYRMHGARVPLYLDQELSPLPPPLGAEVMRRIGRRMMRSSNTWMSSFGDTMFTGADVLVLLGRPEGVIDADHRRAIAERLERHFRSLEALLEVARQRDYHKMERALQTIVLQERCLANLLRCEELGQLPALRGELREVLDNAAGAPTTPYIQEDVLLDLDSILKALEPLGRLDDTSDDALILGRVLPLVVALGKRLQDRRAVRPALVLTLGSLVVESLRQSLMSALDGIEQRAKLSATLRSKVLDTRREAVVVLELENTGRGHASNVVVELEAPPEALRVVHRCRDIKSLLRDQATRFELLVQPRSFDAVRLCFDITYDDLGRRGNRSRFTDTIEFRPPRCERSFAPLVPNPYVVGRPLLDSDLFLGREAIFSRLASSLEGAFQDNIVVLTGQRRMGKTSILRRLHLHLDERYAPVMVDLESMKGMGEADFFRRLATLLVEGLGALGIAVPETCTEAFEGHPGSFFRRRFLKQTRRALGERRLLILFDEFEMLEDSIRSGDLPPRILPYFRSLMQHERNISFVFAGTHRLDELTGDYWGVLFNMAIYLEIGHLGETESKRLFTEPITGSFELDTLALDKLWLLTGGHPYFSQLLAHELVEHGNRHRYDHLAIGDVNAVTELVSARGSLNIDDLWEESSPAERRVLLTTCELLEREGYATPAAVYRFLVDHGIEFGDLPALLHQLGRREILEEKGDVLRFRMELFRQWLREHQDFDSLLSTGQDLPSTGA